MTGSYYVLTTKELISRFISGVNRVGAGYDMSGKLHPKSAEALEAKKQLRLIAEELRSRKPVLELRPLYSHENPDVRVWAAAQFDAIDPEWASAGADGIEDNLTAPQVIELRQRARTRPPASPSLQEMSVGKLVEQFEDAVTREYGSKFITDDRGRSSEALRNRIMDEIGKISGELIRRKALDALLSKLDHPLWMVRYVAAVWCLAIAPQRAIPILEETAKKGPFVTEGLRAAELLEEWHKSPHPQISH